MITAIKKRALPAKTDYFLSAIYLIFFISIVFSFRAVSSISVALILLAGAIRNRRMDSLPNQKNGFLFLLGCSLLFILQCSSLLYTKNLAEGMKLAERSSGFLFTPLAVFASRSFFSSVRHRKLAFYFSLIVSAGALYCLLLSLYHYFNGAPAATLFYHQLVKPLSQHAIQFSILVFCALVFLTEDLKEKNMGTIKRLSRLLIAFLSVFLVLLSSRLLISFYIIYLLSFLGQKRFHKKRSIAVVSVLVILITVVIATPNPVGNRFRIMFAGNSTLFAQKKFDPGIHFNGVQFRLLQWRFTYELLHEQHAWLSGLTPGDAQSFLNKKYVGTHMYIGIAGTEQHGFLGYHTHNQFLQVLLENGWPGLLLFLFICFSLLKMAKEAERKEMKWLVALLLIYCFTDAPLATQYGIIIFTFLPLFFYVQKQKVIGQGSSLTRTFSYLQDGNPVNLPEAISWKQPN